MVHASLFTHFSKQGGANKSFGIAFCYFLNTYLHDLPVSFTQTLFQLIVRWMYIFCWNCTNSWKHCTKFAVLSLLGQAAFEYMIAGLTAQKTPHQNHYQPLQRRINLYSFFMKLLQFQQFSVLISRKTKLSLAAHYFQIDEKLKE